MLILQSIMYLPLKLVSHRCILKETSRNFPFPPTPHLLCSSYLYIQFSKQAEYASIIFVLGHSPKRSFKKTNHKKKSVIHLVLDMAPERVAENESRISTGVLHSQSLLFTFEDTG